MTPGRGFRRGVEALTDNRGAAAVEFVLWLGVLIVPLLSAVDIGSYAFEKMQVQIAGQDAVQAVWHGCSDSTKWPATKNCPNLLTTITRAAQAGSLGTQVTVASAGVVEGYYCANASSALVAVGATGTIATPLTATVPTCTSVTAGSTAAAGDYIKVQVSYTYAPLFTGLSFASILGTSITHTAWMRLN
ncbi:MAG TPA: TadE/TadG family type IV pilus assembly protein [Phenylobacterium sp.]|jgi:Flp pilus assembly protein TadG|nr:TadE/TadG family type IV pilus assembly protein [Phenylobacterium sp.]